MKKKESVATELHRIISIYQKRSDANLSRKYSLLRTPSMYFWTALWKRIIPVILKHTEASKFPIQILDVGCGSGTNLGYLSVLGIPPSSLQGIDLLQNRIEIAKNRFPGISFQQGSADTLPYKDASFEIVLQFTVFSSILDYALKEKIAKEMIRVTKPNGVIIWYDFWANNPWNKDVKGIRLSEIKALFPNATIKTQKITLLPPLARRLAPITGIGCEILEKLRIFNTHHLAFISPSILLENFENRAKQNI